MPLTGTLSIVFSESCHDHCIYFSASSEFSQLGKGGCSGYRFRTQIVQVHTCLYLVVPGCIRVLRPNSITEAKVISEFEHIQECQKLASLENVTLKFILME